jgi:hypothetical protein
MNNISHGEGGGNEEGRWIFAETMIGTEKKVSNYGTLLTIRNIFIGYMEITRMGRLDSQKLCRQREQR